jgi:hypothetical protein
MPDLKALLHPSRPYFLMEGVKGGTTFQVAVAKHVAHRMLRKKTPKPPLMRKSGFFLDIDAVQHFDMKLLDFGCSPPLAYSPLVYRFFPCDAYVVNLQIHENSTSFGPVPLTLGEAESLFRIVTVDGEIT